MNNMSESNHPVVRVGDFIKARSGAEGIVKEVCGAGVWITCDDPTPFSRFGNPVGVDWKDIVSIVPAEPQFHPLSAMFEGCVTDDDDTWKARDYRPPAQHPHTEENAE